MKKEIKSQGWEKDFDKEFKDKFWDTILFTMLFGNQVKTETTARDIIKSFISALLQKEREETLKEVLPKRPEEIWKEEMKNIKGEGNFEFLRGYNYCRAKIIKTALQNWGIKL